MRFDDRFLDEIKARLRLSDVIGRTVKLRRQGREYVGLSPFNKEKSPSFFVNDDKGFFHDFSSGKHGDLIAFLQETERLSFMEAVERLAAEAGVPLPAHDPQAAQAEKKRQGLSDWLDAAAAWFEGELRRPNGREARDYLIRRGLPENEWSRFRIGFAPSSGRTALKDYLVAKGARPIELVDAGLLIAPEDGSAPYDRFRDRIIFPIADGRGRIVSFGGRAMDPNARAKYLNGPDTELFDKGRLLYGLFEARKLLHAGGEGAALVVVEGYMDVIACQRAGIAGVAPMGTALTEGQMEQLWRLHEEPTLCFDGDGAGQRAASRALDRALPLLKPGRSFNFAIVSGGKDPDDVLREQGAAALKAQLAQTTPFVDMLFKREREEAEPLETPERRAGLKVRLRKLAATIADPDLAQAYRQALLDRFEALWPLAAPAHTASGAGRALAGRRWEKARVPANATAEAKAAAVRLAGAPRPMTAAVAQGLLQDPRRLEDKIELLDAQGFCDAELDELARAIVGLRFEVDHLEAEFLDRELRARGYEALLGRISQAASRSGAPFLGADGAERARALWGEAFDLLVRVAAVERALASAKSDIVTEEDYAAFRSLKTERDALERAVRTGAVWEEGAAVH